VPQVEPEEQLRIFRWLPDQIGVREIVNSVIEIEIVRGDLMMTEYRLP
jgi:hypothetical protein